MRLKLINSSSAAIQFSPNTNLSGVWTVPNVGAASNFIFLPPMSLADCLAIVQAGLPAGLEYEIVEDE